MSPYKNFLLRIQLHFERCHGALIGVKLANLLLFVEHLFLELSNLFGPFRSGLAVCEDLLLTELESTKLVGPASNLMPLSSTVVSITLLWLYFMHFANNGVCFGGLKLSVYEVIVSQ